MWDDEAGYAIPRCGSTSSYNPNTDWMFGNQFNAYYRDPKQVGAWEATKKMNDTAFPSEALGCGRPRADQGAQTSAVFNELVIPIQFGWVAYEMARPRPLRS